MNRVSKTLVLCSAWISITASSLIKAEIHRSDLPAWEARESAHYMSPRTRSATDRLGGFDKLIPYVLASPDQEDAGSCLYMAITGIAEWWLARLYPRMPRTADGPLDLSERYIMNYAGVEESDTDLETWQTDSIYLFNKNNNTSLLNTNYRFTKGWYLGEAYSDKLTPTTENIAGSEYGTIYNWIDQRPTTRQGLVRLPTFERDVLFADPEGNQWNVGVAPVSIVDKVKETLRTKEAPVLVVYNQNGYWHAVYIIGFNDNWDNGSCAYTERFRTIIAKRAHDLARLAAQASDPVVKSAYEIRAQRAKEAKDKIEYAYATRGGCTSRKGVFYIRDSIYPSEGGPMYDYDPSRAGDEAPYAKKIVFKEYDWLHYFANHIAVIYPKL